MRFSAIVVLVVLSAVAGCFPMQRGAGGPKSEPSDAEIQQSFPAGVAARLTDVRAKRKAALAAPADPVAANAYADSLIAALQANLGQLSVFDWSQYAKDAAQVLQVSSQNATPEVAADGLVKRASFQAALGDDAGAVQTIKEAFGKAHTFLTGVAMVGVYRVEKKPADAQALCEKTRPMAKSEDDVYKLITECLKAVEEKDTAQQALPWAAADDIALYKRRAQEEADRRLAQRQAEEARDAQRQQEEEAQRAAESQNATSNRGGAAQPAGPTGPKRVSFTMRNSCRDTVHLFYGEKPKYSGGHTDTMSGNSVHGESQNEGAMIWIIDDNENGIASTSVSSGMHELEIGSSCTSFMAH